MGKFFESELVRQELEEIGNLQQEIYGNVVETFLLTCLVRTNWNMLTN